MFFFQTSLKYPDILRSRCPVRIIIIKTSHLTTDYKQPREWINLQEQLLRNFSWDCLRCFKNTVSPGRFFLQTYHKYPEMLRSSGPVRIIFMKTSHLTMVTSNHLNESTSKHSSSENFSWDSLRCFQKLFRRVGSFSRHPWSILTCSEVGARSDSSSWKPHIWPWLSSNHLNESTSKHSSFGNFSWDWLRWFKKLFCRVGPFSRHPWSILTCSEVGARSESSSWKRHIWPWLQATTWMNQPPRTALRKFLMRLYYDVSKNCFAG